MLRFFTVGYQIDRCVGFLTSAIERLNGLRALASDKIASRHVAIDEYEDRITGEEAAIQTLFRDVQRIDKLKGKLEDLLA